jgi:hypothetical protein
MTMGSDPGNLVTFDEGGADLIEAAHRAGGRVGADDEFGLDGILRPRLSVIDAMSPLPSMRTR